MTAQILAIRSASVTFRAVRLRLPFRFGDTLVEQANEAYLVVRTEDGGIGVSAQLMVPRWFDKRPNQSNADTVATLRRSIAAAVLLAEGARGTVADIAFGVRAAVLEVMPDVPPLAAGFGPALLEMAVIDAGARGAGLSFAQAARRHAFGLRAHAPGDVGADRLDAFLGDLTPIRRIRIRHTVGYDAALDCDPGLAPDAPPTALADVVARHGVTAFKIKLKGDPETDIDRLRDVVQIIDAGAPYVATLDANEQYLPDSFADFLDRLSSDPGLDRFRGALRFIEQPLPREIALAQPPPPSDWPLLIDEADDAMDAFPRALALGWSGTSVKSCKGVLRALMNGARAKAAGALLSAEDLTCQPGLCWQQDTVMAATLGLSDLERNGHHFAGGMQGATGAERTSYSAAHPDVYDGASLRIADGAVEIGSLIDAPGFASTPGPFDMTETEGRP